jgi:tetratricopeptide (TPR) repeat protein
MARQFSAKELADLLDGKASAELRRQAVAHLRGGAACDEEPRPSRAGSPGAGRSPRASWGEVFDSAIQLATEHQAQLRRLSAQARRELRSLLSLPPEKRPARITRALSRFRNPVLVDLLLEEGRKQVTADPWGALALVECARDIAFKISERDFGRAWSVTCLARVHGHLGNVHRVIGDFKRAENLLLSGIHLFDDEGNGDPLISAELLSFLASLRTDQGHAVEAEMYLDLARELYEGVGETGYSGRLLVQKSVVLFDAGDLDRAFAVALEAIATIDRQEDPKLYLSAEHNLTVLLTEIGRYREAWERLEGNGSLYDAFPDSWTQLRRQKLAGNILRGLGRSSEAEAILIAVRRGFMEEGLGFYGALTALDLAYLYIEEGRTAEVKQLAEDMVPIFMAQGIHRETAAALLLFQEAARRDAVTTEMLTKLVKYLQRIKARPEGQPS